MAKYAMASGRMAQEAANTRGASDLEFSAPDDLDADLKGDSGQAECSWERKPDGKICITAVNGVSVGKYADGREREEEAAPEEAAMPPEV